VQVKYRLGQAANVTPARQAALRRAHKLIEDLKVLYVRLWSAPENTIPRLLSRMSRKAGALAPSEYEHEALMALINVIAIGALALTRLPEWGDRLGNEVKGAALPIAVKLSLALYRNSYPEFASKIDQRAMEVTITAFSHRVGRAKPTEATKWKAIKLLADKAGLWSPAPESMKREWARLRGRRRQRNLKRRLRSDQ
jgi:hypothetical protein